MSPKFNGLAPAVCDCPAILQKVYNSRCFVKLGAICMHLKQLLSILCVFLSTGLVAEEMLVADAEGNDIGVQVYPSDSDLLIIWLVDHEEERGMFEQMLRAVNAAGAEIWRVDLLDAYFLPRSSENQRTLSGAGVAALIRAAHDKRHKRLLLVAYDRMPLALLRGARLWQQQGRESRLAGAVLFYPNLFGSAPVAGEDPAIAPIVEATNIPLVIYQPEMGSQRWRLDTVMAALWGAGSPAFAYLVPDVRDWFFMGDIDHGPGDKEATRLVPGQLRTFAALLDTYPKAREPQQLNADQLQGHQVHELVKFPRPFESPGFSLPTYDGGNDNWNNYQGKVTLVNFWATWCPPCVEEIPSLNQLAVRYRSREFKVVSIDYRENEQALRQFVQNIPVDFPILLDHDGKVALQWKVFSFPSSFLLDKQGVIRYSANRAIDWDTETTWQVIDQLIAE